MRERKRRCIRAAMGFAVAGAVAGGVGVAGAAEAERDATIGVTAANTWNPSTVSVQTGDTVTWDYTGSQAVHNRKGETGPAEDTAWFEPTDFKTSGTDAHTFNLPGTYTFVCQAHPQMTGSVEVTGAPTEPTPSPTATPTATATASATPRPSTPAPTPAATANDRVTPAPSGLSRSDTIAPTISKLSLKAIRRGAQFRFSLSEPAAVTIRVKKGKRTVKTIRLAARSGGRVVTLRRMSAGRYSFEIAARDARGNWATVQRKSVRVKR